MNRYNDCSLNPEPWFRASANLEEIILQKTYTIKEVADQFDLPISTIRYYDKQGLLPFVAKNDSGYREFTSADLNFIKTIVCLKNTEMPIKDIRQYIKYCMAGPENIEQRRKLLLAHKTHVLRKQAKIMNDLAEIDFKLDRYQNPKAKTIVTAELRFAANEKVAHHLPNPFDEQWTTLPNLPLLSDQLSSSHQAACHY